MSRLDEIRKRWGRVPALKEAHGTVDSVTLRAVQERPARVVVHGFGCANIADAVAAGRGDVNYLVALYEEVAEERDTLRDQAAADGYRMLLERAAEEIGADPPVELSQAIRDLVRERDALAEALRYYAQATGVRSWGMQELGDDGITARRALGLPDHELHCGWPDAKCSCGWPEPQPLTVVRDEVAAACRQVFLDWHDDLNTGETLYQRVSQQPENGDWRCEFSVWDGAQSYGWWGYSVVRASRPDERHAINGWRCVQWDEGDSLLSEDDAWEPKP